MTERRTFEWLTREQQDKVEALHGDRWSEVLATELDEAWPDWERGSDVELQTWLDERLRPSAAEHQQKAADPAGSVEDLAWVDDRQRSVLNGVRPGWSEWLPQQLDQWWRDWRRSTPEALNPWLDTCLPALVPEQPAAPIPAESPVADDESSAAPEIDVAAALRDDDVVAAQAALEAELTGLLAELMAERPELREVPAEQLAAAVQQGLQRSLAR